MPVAAAVVGGAVGLFSANKASKAQSRAANTAAAAQTEGDRLAIEEQKRQFDAIQKLLAPYNQAGTQGLSAQQDLLGINGADKQNAAYNSIANSPAMAAYSQQGENAILQNASATGGLRGGNTQGALAQFRPQLLNQLINQQYANLGGMTSIGQNAAAQTGNAGMQTGQNVSNLLQNTGSANAAAAIAQGQASANQWGAIGNIFGQLGGAFAGSKLF